MKAAHGTSGRIKATAIKLGWSAERDEPPLDYLIERAQAAAVARAGGKTSVIEWKADPSELRAVIEKYVAQRDKALAKQTHVDARQCIYYAAGGALTAIFEALGTFLKQMRPSDRAQVKEVHGLMQLALDHYRETEGRRVAEARAFESQNVETLTAASNDPVAPE